MKIRKEWARTAVDVYRNTDGFAYEAMHVALTAVAPLIAAEVIEVCARHVLLPVAGFRNLGEFGIAGALEDTAEEIRRAVPDLLGLTPNGGK